MCNSQAVNVFMLNNESLVNATAVHAWVNDEASEAANKKLQRKELKNEINLKFKEQPNPIQHLR